MALAIDIRRRAYSLGMATTRLGQRTLRSIYRRGALSTALVACVLAVGTVGMHIIEGMSYVDAFYFMSMLATAQGPTISPSTVAGKLFAAAMAFFSVGTVVAALGFIFGPFFGMLWRVGVKKVEEEEARLASHRSKKEQDGLGAGL